MHAHSSFINADLEAIVKTVKHPLGGHGIPKCSLLGFWKEILNKAIKCSFKKKYIYIYICSGEMKNVSSLINVPMVVRWVDLNKEV